MNRLVEDKKVKTSPKITGAKNWIRRILGLSSDAPSMGITKIISYGALLAIVYIFNSYLAESKAIEINKITKENKQLRSEYILVKSKVMYYASQSELTKRLASERIKEATVPPQKISKKEVK